MSNWRLIHKSSGRGRGTTTTIEPNPLDEINTLTKLDDCLHESAYSSDWAIAQKELFERYETIYKPTKNENDPKKNQKMVAYMGGRYYNRNGAIVKRTDVKPPTSGDFRGRPYVSNTRHRFTYTSKIDKFMNTQVNKSELKEDLIHKSLKFALDYLEKSFADDMYDMHNQCKPKSENSELPENTDVDSTQARNENDADLKVSASQEGPLSGGLGRAATDLQNKQVRQTEEPESEKRESNPIPNKHILESNQLALTNEDLKATSPSTTRVVNPLPTTRAPNFDVIAQSKQTQVNTHVILDSHPQMKRNDCPEPLIRTHSVCEHERVFINTTAAINYLTQLKTIVNEHSTNTSNEISDYIICGLTDALAETVEPKHAERFKTQWRIVSISAGGPNMLIRALIETYKNSDFSTKVPGGSTIHKLMTYLLLDSHIINP